jgi:superfamily II DNA or RNA helicase
MELPDYQIQGLECINDAYRRRTQSVLYVAPIGSGETHLFSHIGAEAVRKASSVLGTAHRVNCCGRRNKSSWIRVSRQASSDMENHRPRIVSKSHQCRP